jgi:hypothetical protein
MAGIRFRYSAPHDRLVDFANDLDLLAWLGEAAIWCRFWAALHLAAAPRGADLNLKLVVAALTVPDFRGHIAISHR